ncbi:hypothetical protein [Candidatus Methanocrinis natronophilus]|uniref:Uncharacterized protein n=1 Tax=Candidatus Methanocrinis natronophilus TaxID=3033396 RepID=A0ABT5X7X5_9EURY|nr:hypothetical protein [Candidatus Methanocrinis natronophilus]MDF0590796.1 hypothetical protein [Candidatus Methanocrinis natronophilus]
MRRVIILSILVALVTGNGATGAEPVSVGGDFGISWLKNQPYQPVTGDDGDGLWSWGGVPRGKEVVNDTLQLSEIGDDETGLVGIGWLGQGSFGPPVQVTYPKTAMDFMYPFYSDDPWILAQHYGRVIRTNLEDIPRDWIPYIDEYLKNR